MPINKIRQTGYLWPGVDAVADLMDLHDKSALRHQIRRYFSELRQRYGRETLKLVFALHGTQATFAHLDEVRAHQDALACRLAETPNLLPLFGRALAFARVPADVSGYRQHALRLGLTPAGWRWLTHQSRTTARKLTRPGLTPRVIAWLNLLAKVGEPLPPRLLDDSGLLCLGDIEDQVIGTLSHPLRYAAAERSVVLFLRLTLTTYQQRARAGTLQTFWHEYQLLAWELIRALRQNRPLLQPGSTWASALRRQHLAMEQRLFEARQQAENAELSAAQADLPWTSAVAAYAVHGIEVVPLCCNEELLQEGALLEHCVGDGTYLALCQTGHSRLFSLRGGHTHFRATLQLSRDSSNTWRVTQLKTFANATPPAIFHKVADHVCRAYNQAG